MMKNTGRMLLVALAAIFAFGSVDGFERKIGSEERRLYGWKMGAADKEEQYRSIYCRCCADVVGARNFSAATIPECAPFAGQTCNCPVREEIGQSWWNFFSADIQGRWNNSCSTDILDRANITVTAPPTTDAVDVEDGLTVTATTRKGGN